MSTKRKLPQKIGQPKVKPNAKVLGKGNLDESKAVVSGGGNAGRPNVNGVKDIVEISSDSGSDDEEDLDQEPIVQDVVMDDVAHTPQEENDENVEPSFGDLVRANASEPIDVAGAFEDGNAEYSKGTQIQAPSGASLGTVLSQALRTNDVELLESCLHTADKDTIRATIQRLESPLAGILLERLADRLHRKPGRAGNLMLWIQWTLITHGGYLATQKALMKKLAELNKVIDERAKSLQSLLVLKGKLDLLEAQITLRKSMQAERQRNDEDEEDDVIYVEDQESEDEHAVTNGAFVEADFSDAGSEASEDMPMTNGVIADSDDEEGESSDDENVIDNEAEETDADSGDEDDVDHDDQDSLVDDDESDDGAGAPPPKMARTGLSKRR